MLDRTKNPIQPNLDASKIDLSILSPLKGKLDNGLEIFSFINDATQIVKIDLLFRAGTVFQKKSFCAIATAQLLTEGTSHHSAQEIADFLDFRGAYIEKSVEKEAACITVYALEKHIYEILPLLKEILEEPAFPEEELALFISKKRQQFEIESQKTGFVARNKFTQLVFGEDHPYGKIGTLEDFSLLKREDLIEFHSVFYANSSCDIILSGCVTQKLINSVNTYFGQSKKTPNTILLNIPEIKTNPHSFFQKKDDAVQSTIRIGKVCISPTHEDFAGLSVLNSVFGGYFGSRLMKNIREDKGYTYGIYSLLQVFRGLSVFFVTADVGSDVTNKAIDEVYNEMHLLQTALVDDEELNIVKNYLVGSFIRSIDGVFELSERYKTLLQNNLSIDFFAKYLQEITEITPEKLEMLSQKYLDKPSFFEICVGNK